MINASPFLKFQIHLYGFSFKMEIHISQLHLKNISNFCRFGTTIGKDISYFINPFIPKMDMTDFKEENIIRFSNGC